VTEEVDAEGWFRDSRRVLSEKSRGADAYLTKTMMVLMWWEYSANDLSME